jgi:hypothetical protein
MKFIYLVENFVPFPQSEGGLFQVIAKDNEECFDLIADYDEDQNVQHYNKLRENISKSPSFALLDEEESRIVGYFGL